MRGPLLFWLVQKLRICENRSYSLRLVARKQFGTELATRLLFKIHIGKGLPIGVFHHKAAIQFLD